jgi:leucyl aminopeptidase
LNFEVVAGDITKQTTAVAVVNLFSGVTAPGGATGAVDSAIGSTISKLIEAGEIKGGASEATVIHTLDDRYGDFTPDRVLVAGLGKSDNLDADSIRKIAATVARRVRSIGASEATTILHGAGIGGIDPSISAEAIVEGSILGTYEFKNYKSSSDDDDESKGLETFTIIELDSSKVAEVQAAVDRSIRMANAEALARDLVNHPPNIMTPTRLAAEAADVAEATDGLSITVLERADAEKMGMGAYLGVAQGSHEPPKIIRLDYAGDPDDADNNLWIIGKGITFDSGGLSLKPSSGMETMKSDMAGGASVIAAARAIAEIGPKINVTALCLATENMPGGGAQRVSDVVQAMNGTYIEVINTDAEGRLTLADALVYARENGAKRMVDIATLTGGIVVALGKGNSGVFSNDEDLVNALIAAGDKRGQSFWRLPLDDVAKRQNRSKIADLKNTGGRLAHAITAAHFIGEFAEDTPWVHLDIAATAMSDGTNGILTAGATGAPTRTLVQLAIDLAAANS